MILAQGSHKADGWMKPPRQNQDPTRVGAFHTVYYSRHQPQWQYFKSWSWRSDFMGLTDNWNLRTKTKNLLCLPLFGITPSPLISWRISHVETPFLHQSQWIKKSLQIPGSWHFKPLFLLSDRKLFSLYVACQCQMMQEWHENDSNNMINNVMM